MARVLVVDDVPDLRDMLAESLFNAGFDVATVSSVSEAKDFLTLQGSGCLVLLDLHLDDVPGEALLAWIRSHPLHRSMPVVVMTADSGIKAVPGSNAFVRKPFDVERLAGILAQQYARWTN
jgi:DNA-binding NtrC family response regulator